MVDSHLTKNILIVSVLCLAGGLSLIMEKNQSQIPTMKSTPTTTTIQGSIYTVTSVMDIVSNVPVSSEPSPVTSRSTSTVKPVATTRPKIVPVPTSVKPNSTLIHHNNSAFLECVKQRESRGQYAVVNGSSGAAGAYQLMPETARNTALHAGRGDLAGSPASSWSRADQDAMAQHLLQWQGKSPWAGPGCG